MKRNKPHTKLFWMIYDSTGTVWLGSASPFSKRGAIKNWMKSSGEKWDWKKWYGQGYRVGQFYVSVKAKS